MATDPNIVTVINDNMKKKIENEKSVEMKID